MNFVLLTPTFFASNYQVELTRAKVESLRSEIANADERVSQLKSQYNISPYKVQFQRLCGQVNTPLKFQLNQSVYIQYIFFSGVINIVCLSQVGEHRRGLEIHTPLWVPPYQKCMLETIALVFASK
jgi:hypothetical protein